MGVQSLVSWPCGRDTHPKPDSHQRRVPRHEARGLGYWFWPWGRCRAAGVTPPGRWPRPDQLFLKGALADTARTIRIDRPRVRTVANVSTTMMTADPMSARGAHYTALLDLAGGTPL
jgi:hypothetical protein